MKLDLVKGFETSLIIDKVEESIKENGFLAGSYIKAKEALKDYVGQADSVRKELEKEKTVFGVNNCLYRSPQNIIAFSGKRGTGKTSTMLSFSQSLSTENSIIKLEALQNRDVVVLDPIDPTMLENDQNILNVVLSRLLFKAEEVWNQSMDYSRRYQDKEKEKNEILSVAKKCLNGIAAIKSKSSMETLVDLQKVGDSAILKREFFKLVELLNRFCLSSLNTFSNYPLLVLQIDDTDCQISKGYQVMEDIRRYLTIPNVVIFMAVDIDMMRWVITQHYVNGFDSCLKQNFFEKEETRHYADKYMAKLFPPARKIYLPVVDDIIKNRVDTLELGYYEADDADKKNNILKRGNGFQSKVLNFIYQKTHLVFVVHDAYLNNIVPTTLRGLTYLLNILGTMEDVPEFDISKINDVPGIIEEWNKQLPILERNLDIFEEYFMNDWIQAKLSHEMIEIMEKVASQVPEERISYAYNEFLNYYNKKVGNDLDLDVRREKTKKATYYYLDHLLQKILGTTEILESKEIEGFRQTEDFYNIFSIRTLLSIKNSKDIVKIKRKAIKKAEASSDTKLVIDYAKQKSSLPDSLYLDDKEYGEVRIVAGSDDRKDRKDKKVYNFTDAIIAVLSDERADFWKLPQERIFVVQEMAILIACSFEVQEVVRKTIKRMESEKKFSTRKDAVMDSFKKIQGAILKMNDDMLRGLEVNDIFPFIYLNFEEKNKRQKEQDAFEIISEMLEGVKDNYPHIKNEEREEKIEGILKSMGQELSKSFMQNRKCRINGLHNLSKKLEEFKFLYVDNNLENEKEYCELLGEVEEMLSVINTQKLGNK